MIKIVVSNKIYLKLPENLVENITSRFTFNIYSHPQQKYPKIVRQIFKISDEVYQLERGCLDYVLELFNENRIEYEIIDRTVSKPVEFPTLLLPPRDDQSPIIDDFAVDSRIDAPPGFGKTATAIGIISKLKQRTLIICTTTAIRDNWISEINKFLGIKAGILGSGARESDADIVVGNYQTVTKLSLDLSKSFGLIIVDEMHHAPADSFLNILTNSHAKYRLGLSGTMKRKDGLHVVFEGLFGNKVYSPAVNNVMTPIIYRVPCHIELSGNSVIPWATKINNIYQDPSYLVFITILLSILERKNYITLLTSDRIEFTQKLHELYNNTSRLFIGEVPVEDRNMFLSDIISGKANKIFASTSLFSEGISCNPLSALIHTSSTNNESLVYQLIGRIQRIVEGKQQPIVIDICFSGAAGKKHAKERKTYYLVKGWKIVDVDIDKLEDIL